ncbi:MULTISPECIES: formate dehydrogenase subunit gamma [unclassified Yoonia]|uniref:formate dehydrogenase subunit gamma n=1 Tax=unclassified Yoonia TaxID=2629118 RepID=UPI002AFFEFAA|nr:MULTISPECIES: formate dehydrogenase subunit gamma [unclassified Yoonia]
MRYLSQFMIAIAVLVFMGQAAPVAVAQVNPTANSVTEDSMFEALTGDENAVAGRVSIPDRSAGNLIKPENKSWAAFQGGTVQTLSIIAVVGMVVLLALFYMIRGRIRVESGFSGRKILRFGAIDRFAHWTMAATFIILALTGLNLIVGSTVVLPIIGEGAFGTLTAFGKLAHNYLAWPFMVALVLVFILWVIDNIPNKLDLEWIKQGGGLLKKGVHPPAKKFNAGQKVIFWSVILGGAGLSFTGVMMLFPGMTATPADWQLYQMIHALIAAGLTAIIVAHIYIGSVGMEGAFDAMGTGEVDENWAKEHHGLWVDEVKAKSGKTSPISTPAE